jgi:uncharacterized protein YsxB (DUF464 family)
MSSDDRKIISLTNLYELGKSNPKAEFAVEVFTVTSHETEDGGFVDFTFTDEFLNLDKEERAFILEIVLESLEHVVEEYDDDESESSDETDID